MRPPAEVKLKEVRPEGGWARAVNSVGCCQECGDAISVPTPAYMCAMYTATGAFGCLALAADKHRRG
jgi:hypothetical protein